MQDINCVELYAFYMALRHSLPGATTFTTDSSFVQKGVFERGRAECTGVKATHADLWRAVWKLLDEDWEGLQLTKVMAHASEQDVVDGKTTWEQKLGNDAAEVCAKKRLPGGPRSSGDPGGIRSANLPCP